jgi:hypothetical protein
MPSRVSMNKRQTAQTSVPRPRRFPLHMLAWYRPVNEQRWRTGVTQSISTTGVLIRVNEPVTSSGQILVEIPLPVAPGCLFGEGRVVRTVSQEPTGTATITVAVDRYRIGRRADPPPRTLVA